MSKQYVRLQQVSEKWHRKIQSTILKLFGRGIQQYSTEVYFKNSDVYIEKLPKTLQSLIQQNYDPELKLSRIFLKVVDKVLSKQIKQLTGIFKQEYVSQCIANLVTRYKHVRIPEYGLILILSKEDKL